MLVKINPERIIYTRTHIDAQKEREKKRERERERERREKQRKVSETRTLESARDETLDAARAALAVHRETLKMHREDFHGSRGEYRPPAEGFALKPNSCGTAARIKLLEHGEGNGALILSSGLLASDDSRGAIRTAAKGELPK